MKINKSINLRTALLMGITALPFLASAQDTGSGSDSTYFSNALFNTLLITILLLLIMIVALGSALRNVIESDLYLNRLKKQDEDKKSGAGPTTVLTAFFFLLQMAAQAQDGAPQGANDRIGGLDQFTFYTMVTTIGAELLVLAFLFNMFKNVLGTDRASRAAAGKKTKTVFDQLAGTVEPEVEERMLLDHNYDGIRELDNNLPPWWKYGFYLTILISVIYLVNYHVTGSSPLQKEEYALSVKKAEAQIAEFMKNSANNVDESTVKMLTDASDLATGKDLFIASCAACHGRLGEGGVGPNLTDDYWIHGGSVKDIFKTLKYGWPDKGMKAWKEDFSAMQLAQITSYVRTLKGTNPPKQKDKQGELYTEVAVGTADSTIANPDTLQASATPTHP